MSIDYDFIRVGKRKKKLRNNRRIGRDDYLDFDEFFSNARVCRYFVRFISVLLYRRDSASLIPLSNDDY